MKSYGKFIEPVSVSINIEQFCDYVQDTLKELVLDFLNDHADNASDNKCDIYIEDGILYINDLDIEGSYTSHYYPATLIDPPEYDLEVTPDDDDLTGDDLQQYLMEHAPEWLRPYISHVKIAIDSEHREIKEYEPDWDSMPGGHDDI